MTSGEESAFDQSKFINPHTGDLDNLMEFDRQTDELIAEGNIDPILAFLAEKISGDDQKEGQLYATFLLNLMERVNDSAAVLFHAINLTEPAEQAGNHIQAATTSRIASSVYLEKGQLRDAATWFTRMRTNLSAPSPPLDNEMVEAVAPVLLRGTLEYESYYLLELATRGKAKQVKREIAELDASPFNPAERHVLASTLAFIESDSGNHLASMQAIKRAETLAEEVGDFADASIYASRRTTQIMHLFGGMGVKAALDEAAAYLEQARSSDNDPELITKAKDQLESRRELFN